MREGRPREGEEVRTHLRVREAVRPPRLPEVFGRELGTACRLPIRRTPLLSVYRRVVHLLARRRLGCRGRRRWRREALRRHTVGDQPRAPLRHRLFAAACGVALRIGQALGLALGLCEGGEAGGCE